MHLLRPWRLLILAFGLALPGGCGPGVGVAVALVIASDGDDDDGDSGGSAPACETPAGVPDTSLGGSGWIIRGNTMGVGGDDRGRGIAIDRLERIVVCGEGDGPSGNLDIIVWRFLADGSPDLSFYGQGWVSHNGAAGGASRDLGEAGIAIDSLGRILVGGSSRGSNQYDVAIWCFLEDGFLDTSFAGQGWIVRDSIAGGQMIDRGLGMALDGSQRILVTGMSYGNTGNMDMFILRYLPDGNPDLSFGYGGIFVHRGVGIVNSSTDEGRAIAFDAEGRVFVAGKTMEDPITLDPEMCVWGFDPFGLPDPSFGEGGKVVHRDLGGGWGQDSGEAIAVDSYGRIVVAGWITDPTGDRDAAMWRYHPDGTPDRSFGGKGFVIQDNAAGGMGLDEARGMTLDCDGGALVCGTSRNPTNDRDMAIWRLGPTGFLDPHFGTLGVVVHRNAAGGVGDDWGEAIVRDATGRVVVAGYSEDSGGGDEAVVWRYQ